MPGDICFNCGRISTLLVTPRPPRNLIEKCTQTTAKPTLRQVTSSLGYKAFDSQFNQIETLLAATKKLARHGPQHGAFDSQLTAVDDLLDASEKLAHVQALAADDVMPFDDGDSSSFGANSTSSSGPFSGSSKAYFGGASRSSSRTLRSDSAATSDILSEDGRPRADVVRRWLESARPSGRSEAKLTRRGVDCRYNWAGRSYEWVIFL